MLRLPHPKLPLPMSQEVVQKQQEFWKVGRAGISKFDRKVRDALLAWQEVDGRKRHPVEVSGAVRCGALCFGVRVRDWVWVG